MARADSTIRVNIIGDARSLQGALRTGEAQVGGFGRTLKGIGTGIVAAFAADAVFDFGRSAIDEFDRVGDATLRLRDQLGDLAAPLIDAAGGLEDLGQSRQDVLELEAAFADAATALGAGKDDIAAWADDAAETAAALALVGDADAATIMDAIGKAAGGSDRALRTLGINLSDAAIEERALFNSGKDNPKLLTDQELAAAGLQLVMEKLAPRVRDVVSAEDDLEQNQAELQAKMETLAGKIGEHVEGPLNDFLDWTLNGVQGLEDLAAAMPNLGQKFKELTGPIGIARDALAAFVGLLDTALVLAAQFTGVPRIIGGSGPEPRGSLIPGAPGGHATYNVNVQGGSPEEVQSAVLKAISTLGNHGTEFDN